MTYFVTSSLTVFEAAIRVKSMYKIVIDKRKRENMEIKNTFT